nr:hypothetical protein [Tanacetum cinerariifolium]
CSNLNGDNNDGPQQVNTLPKVVDNNSKDYDSPAFALGPATQKEVFTRVDKVVEEFKSSKKGNDFKAPNFCFGVTQDFDMVLSLETLVTDTNIPVLGFANQLEPINAMPVSMCKPVLKDEDVVHDHGKRKYTKSQATRLETKGRKQNIMLAHLRKRYAATLLLLKCNMHSNSVRAQLDGIQVAEVPIKRMKLPMRGK